MSSIPEHQSIPIGNPQGPSETVISRSSHPIALIFHLLFKVIAFVVFLFGSSLQSYVLVFVICTLSLAFDFWTTKNVSGRLLVGLRWWSMEDKWVFESRPNYSPNSSDSFVFWSTMVGFTALWILFGFLYLLQFPWLVICVVAVLLNGSNLYGYYKCNNQKSSIFPSSNTLLGAKMFGMFSSQQNSASTAL
eukprot:NODE_40_length_29852_cov_0.370215.p14 type:complete len:191 gc:universal NODE_40_length_29852_cov_0.370215:6828-6256(-)